MGKDFIPLRANHINDAKAVEELYHRRFVREASNEKYFHNLPDKKDIAEVELGDEKQGTHETIFRLRNGDFIVVNKTISTRKLRSMI
jgi:hypothetical protein